MIGEHAVLLSMSYSEELVFKDDGLVLRHKSLHDAPADEVGHGAEKENTIM